MSRIVKLADGDDGDGCAGASVTGQKETGRWRAGDNSDVKSSNVKDELAFNLMEYLLATRARIYIY